MKQKKLRFEYTEEDIVILSTALLEAFSSVDDLRKLDWLNYRPDTYRVKVAGGE